MYVEIYTASHVGLYKPQVYWALCRSTHPSCHCHWALDIRFMVGPNMHCLPLWLWVIAGSVSAECTLHGTNSGSAMNLGLRLRKPQVTGRLKGSWRCLLNPSHNNSQHWLAHYSLTVTGLPLLHHNTNPSHLTSAAHSQTISWYSMSHPYLGLAEWGINLETLP